jgi:hypothetical protein
MIFTFRIGFIFILFFLPSLYSAESSDFAADDFVSDTEPQPGTTARILDAAESEFRQAIALDQHNGEAYYFLGRVYYEQATLKMDISGDGYTDVSPPAPYPPLSLQGGEKGGNVSQSQQTIGKAKAFLLRAQELGMTYDKLHPDLLSRLKQDYPKVAPIYEEELFPKKAKIAIETEQPTFEIRASKISEQDVTVIVGTFLSEEEIQLESGASYQLEFSPPKPKGIKHIILIGIGLAICLIR